MTKTISVFVYNIDDSNDLKIHNKQTYLLVGNVNRISEECNTNIYCNFRMLSSISIDYNGLCVLGECRPE